MILCSSRSSGMLKMCVDVEGGGRILGCVTLGALRSYFVMGITVVRVFIFGMVGFLRSFLVFLVFLLGIFRLCHWR